MPGTDYHSKEAITVQQSLSYCQECTHSFLDAVVDPPYLYAPADYRTISSNSKTSLDALERFTSLIRSAVNKFTIHGERDNIILIDIGSNDSTLLKLLEHDFNSFIGIDPLPKHPSEFSKPLQLYPNLCDKFDFGTLENLNTTRVFVSSHTLEHVASPRNFFESLQKHTTTSDLFVFQFPSLECLIQFGRYFQVHNQHLQYFSVRSFERLLSDFDFTLLQYSFDRNHYGALQVVFKKAGANGLTRPIVTTPPRIEYSQLVSGIKRFERSAQYFDSMIADYQSSIVGYGAGLMFPIVCFHYQSIRELKYVIDNNTSKIGIRYLGTQAEVISIERLNEFDLVIVCTFPSEGAYRSSVSRLIEHKECLENEFDIFLPFLTL